jgi:hypothetical protein
MKLFQSEKPEFSISFDTDKSKPEIFKKIRELKDKQKFSWNPSKIFNQVDYTRFQIGDEEIIILHDSSNKHLRMIHIFIDGTPYGKSVLRFEIMAGTLRSKILHGVFIVIVFIMMTFYGLFEGLFQFDIGAIANLVLFIIGMSVISLYDYLFAKYEKYRVVRIAKHLIRDINEAGL